MCNVSYAQGSKAIIKSFKWSPCFITIHLLGIHLHQPSSDFLASIKCFFGTYSRDLRYLAPKGITGLDPWEIPFLNKVNFSNVRECCLINFQATLCKPYTILSIHKNLLNNIDFSLPPLFLLLDDTRNPKPLLLGWHWVNSHCLCNSMQTT